MWVRNTLQNDEKFDLFCQLFRYPVKTNEVTGQIFDRLSRIFNSSNASFEYIFDSEEDRNDWDTYRRSVLQEPNVWQNEAWEYFKTDINSVLVVDMPEGGSKGRKNPYFYFVKIENIVNYSALPNGHMEWIVFRDGERLIMIDDECYCSFIDENGDIDDVKESRHGLGYCPAMFFGNTSISLSYPDVKSNPITKVLGTLDMYLFKVVCKQHLELYNSYPVMMSVEAECDYENELHEHCENGVLYKPDGTPATIEGGGIKKCPKCGDGRKLYGPGSHVSYPAPGKDITGEEVADMRNPVQLLDVAKDSLDYNVEECNRLREEIISTCCGTAGEILHSEALNETQVEGNFDIQTTILCRVKKAFEEAQKFVDDTICRLRYGDSFRSSTINYGTDFYFYSSTILRNQYTLAKTSGASESELDALYYRLIRAEYRNNPILQQRMKMLADIEPNMHLTRNEVSELYDKGVISDEDYLMKMNFTTYLHRYERENMDIMSLSEEIPYTKRIDMIIATIRSYAAADALKITKSNN